MQFNGARSSSEENPREVFTPPPHPEAPHEHTDVQRVSLLSLPARLSLRDENKKRERAFNGHFGETNTTYLHVCDYPPVVALTIKPGEPL